jgi:hypothetical protein
MTSPLFTLTVRSYRDLLEITVVCCLVYHIVTSLLDRLVFSPLDRWVDRVAGESASEAAAEIISPDHPLKVATGSGKGGTA